MHRICSKTSRKGNPSSLTRTSEATPDRALCRPKVREVGLGGKFCPSPTQREALWGERPSPKRPKFLHVWGWATCCNSRNMTNLKGQICSFTPDFQNISLASLAKHLFSSITTRVSAQTCSFTPLFSIFRSRSVHLPR